MTAADHLLIRARGVGAAEIRLRDHLAPAFGDRIRFVVDASAGPAPVAAGAEGQTVAITPDWLADRGLVRFAESGWRCGDYCYYAALDHVAGLQRAWLIESDVWPSFANPADFFGPLQDQSADLLAPGYRQRGDDWFWTWTTIRALGEGPVWGCLFPITRMTAPAIAHCAAARAASIAAGAARGQPDWTDAVPFPMPNDEGFVATTLTRNGFSGRDLKALLPGAFTDAGFSWDAPLMPAEAMLPGMAGQILHPVLEAAQARPKLALLKKRRPGRFASRRDEAVAAVGQPAWDIWAGPEA